MSPTLVRAIFDTLSLTSILVLLVIGMAIIVGMMKVFNMCQGELVLLGAVTALTFEFLRLHESQDQWQRLQGVLPEDLNRSDV